MKRTRIARPPVAQLPLLGASIDADARREVLTAIVRDGPIDLADVTVPAPPAPRARRVPKTARGRLPRFRVDLTHPVTKKRVRFNCLSAQERERHRAWFEYLRRELAEGHKTADEVRRILRRTERGGVPSVREVLVAYATSGKLRDTTRGEIMKVARARMATLLDLRFEQLTAPRVLEWIDEQRGRGIADVTIKTAWGYLAAAGTHAVEMGKMDSPPWSAGWKPRLRTTRATPVRELARTLEELSLVIAAAKRIDHGRRERRRFSCLAAKIAAVAFLGLRNGELGGLGWDDFGPELAAVTIRHQAIDDWKTLHPTWTRPVSPPKNGIATLDVHPNLRDMLVEQRNYLKCTGRYSDDGPVFPGAFHHGRGWQANALSLTPADVREVARVAGVGDPARWVPTSLRDTFVMLEAATHGDAKMLAMRTRHASLSSLQRYMQQTTRALVPSGIGALPPFDDDPTSQKPKALP